MRDGDVTVTKNHEEVMAEAKFYLLEELVKLCKPVLPSRGFKISIINDEQLLQILAEEPLKPVLLILYRFNEKMYLPENTLLYGIVLYFSPRFEVYFREFTGIVTIFKTFFQNF
ncbi:BTB domain-containing protein [Caenorhabditis elegans]|uniref:BTB domain-containing protein n=1 Tax=Caenorhabditis elegans TaxID=6239 RepID=O17256_CAEEL|nr:BTB domain-containing protein [Caenorhabditis elegans]CCD63498.2 BTB domain-containing protein [Caenorhabditis elegans]|eukprot:NP_872071.2 Uncharacterized protein CELE_K02E7.4 [Caenorhabditis elegans]